MTKPGILLVASVVVLILLVGCASSASYERAGRQAPAAISQAKTQQLQEGIYFVQKGDTLTAISKKFGVTNLQLQYRNHIADPHSLAIGQRLVIPDKKQQVPSSFANKARFIWPLKKLDVSSEFGSRNNRHKGMDLRAPKGTRIRASGDGVVHFVGRQSGYGKVIIIKHEGDIQTFYAHNEKNLVKKGQRVRQGEVIATVGRTGNATGYHVHFEFIKGRQPLNPRHYVSSEKG